MLRPDGIEGVLRANAERIEAFTFISFNAKRIF